MLTEEVKTVSNGQNKHVCFNWVCSYGAYNPENIKIQFTKQHRTERILVVYSKISTNNIYLWKCNLLKLQVKNDFQENYIMMFFNVLLMLHHWHTRCLKCQTFSCDILNLMIFILKFYSSYMMANEKGLEVIAFRRHGQNIWISIK